MQQIDKNKLDSMNVCMKHRGPHSDGFFYDDNVGLAVRRLRIIDLETGDQPIFNETKDVVVIFNGEIYNFKSLREDLEGKGHHFKSKTDTEVLIHGYEEWGIDQLLSTLNGMYAFCIYDKQKRKIYLARDRLGEKPLYYYFDGNELVFASELLALLASGKVPTKISKLGLYCYLSLHYVPGDMCIIQEAKKLLPGYYLEFDLQSFKANLIEYWELEETELVEDHKYLRQVKELVEDSIRSRLIADVPIGVFLSGGIDSSIIVAVMKKYRSIVNTFSIGFQFPEFDESEYSRTVAEVYKTNHHHFILDHNKIRELLPMVISYMDEPNGDQALLPIFWLSHEAQKYVTVVLGGEGGDEIFGGYSYYPTHETSKGYHNQRKSNELLDGLLRDGITETLSGFPLISDLKTRSKLIKDFDLNELRRESQKYLWLERFRRNSRRIKDFLRLCQYTDIKTWLPDDLLTKFDRMTMSASLEGRAPYLDHRLVEVGFNLPSLYKIKGDAFKFILREAFKSELPEQIFRRAKQAFNLPMSEWLRTYLRDLVESLDNLSYDDGIDNRYLRTLINEHLSGKVDRGRLLYALLVYKLWIRNLFRA